MSLDAEPEKSAHPLTEIELENGQVFTLYRDSLGVYRLQEDCIPPFIRKLLLQDAETIYESLTEHHYTGMMSVEVIYWQLCRRPMDKPLLEGVCPFISFKPGGDADSIEWAPRSPITRVSQLYG